MRLVVILAIIALPLVMFILSTRRVMFGLAFDLIGVICVTIVGSMAAIDVHENNFHGTMFTTNVHHILLNPWFLLTSSYLGIYLIYTIYRSAWSHIRSWGSHG